MDENDPDEGAARTSSKVIACRCRVIEMRLTTSVVTLRVRFHEVPTRKHTSQQPFSCQFIEMLWNRNHRCGKDRTELYANNKNVFCNRCRRCRHCRPPPPFQQQQQHRWNDDDDVDNNKSDIEIIIRQLAFTRAVWHKTRMGCPPSANGLETNANVRISWQLDERICHSHKRAIKKNSRWFPQQQPPSKWNSPAAKEFEIERKI